MDFVFNMAGRILFAFACVWNVVLALAIFGQEFGIITLLLIIAGMAWVMFGKISLPSIFISSRAILPIVFLLIPWYTALFDSNWFPVTIIYGCSITAFVYRQIGSAIHERREAW